jgi:molybdenum cofactor cytidylyltransferase
MKFGAVSPDEAEGGIVVHSIRSDNLVLKKGTLVGQKEIAALKAANIAAVTVARLEPGDVSEDEAAGDIAAVAAGENVRVDEAFTGRSNLYAEAGGVVVVNSAAIDRLNEVDPDITLATLEAFAPVVPGKMIATVKIIPFAITRAARDKAVEVARAEAPLVRVAPYVVKKVGIVSTLLPGLADKVIDKTLRVTAERLKPAGATIIAELRVPHETAALAEAIRKVLAAGAEFVVVFGASAIADRRDVIPAAVEAVGGKVEHFGMPVDPGNLMLIASAQGRPVLGAPGCARSPKENGFDWVLSRLLCGLPVTRHDIMGMGVGGLLMEIVTRPQPRASDTPDTTRRVAAVVLAAGRSTRMGDQNKLLSDVGGRPMVRAVVDQVLKSKARPVIVVTGHQRERVEEALRSLPVRFVHNPAFAEGLSTSVKTGIAAVPADSDGAIVCLGDMPQIDSALIDKLLGAFDPERGAFIVMPTLDGQRGNPIVWSRRFFPELAVLEGDIGARNLLKSYPEAIVDVPVESHSVLTDIDTPEELAVLRSELSPAR